MKKERLMMMLQMTPHAILAGVFMMTANNHLLMIPFMTGAMHWMWINRHFSKMTLYYDLYKLGNNPNMIASYGKVREVLLTDPQFSLYINQPLTHGEDSKDLIIENPVFQPFSYKLEGLTGKLDAKRTRYQFDCHFKDISKDSEGKIQSLIIFNDMNEAYFESLTVFINKPIEKAIRIKESEIEHPSEDVARFNRPKKPAVKSEESDPQERPKAKHRQY